VIALFGQAFARPLPNRASPNLRQGLVAAT